MEAPMWEEGGLNEGWWLSMSGPGSLKEVEVALPSGRGTAPAPGTVGDSDLGEHCKSASGFSLHLIAAIQSPKARPLQDHQKG